MALATLPPSGWSRSALGRPWPAALVRVAFVIALILAVVPPARADTVVLRSGEILQTTVDRFTDGAFWMRRGSQTVVVYPEDIVKIVFDGGLRRLSVSRPDTQVSSRAASYRPGRSTQPPPADHGFPGDVLAASAAGDDEPESSAQGLVILNYDAVITSGIFQVVGDVQNRMPTEARYVKVTVMLLDSSGGTIAQNFSYLLGKSPNLASMDKKSFRVSFLNPPPGVAKYKIRVESSPF